MNTTKLSTKGQVILPQVIRETREWKPGTEFLVEEVAGGILLRPLKPFPASRLEDVAGCLRYSGRPRTIAEMNRAVEKETKARRDRGRY